MFGIQELDEMVYPRLTQQDLAQCVRVNKKWHTATIPYLWHSFSRLRYSPIPTVNAFRRVVLEDYLHEQHGNLQEEGYRTKEPALILPSRPFPSLAKYGPWIRILPPPSHLLGVLEYDSSQPHPYGLDVEPSAHDLLCHLYKHCSAMQVQDLLLFTKDLHSVVLMKALARYVLPLTHHLEVKSVPSDPYLTSSMLQHLLDHCSQLEELILHISGLYDGDDSEDEQNWTAMPGTFKQLTLFRCADKESESKMFWSWFWRRCGQVERLKLRDVADITQILVKGMAIHMVKLHAITFRDAGSRPLNDEEVSGILSSSLHGWRRVEMRNMTIERDAKSALARHYPTLEGLLFHELQGFGDNDMVQVLSSCPNLRVMVDLGYRVSNRILAEDFVDRDSTDSLKPWACEVTLRELKVKVSGIPRPEVRECHIKERHPGQGHEIQSQVYDRLARLTNLEVLWLGDIHEMGVQNECLEMSLKSGLYKLSGLKKLKELNISGMETRMDMNEIQWITQNWPQLRIIYGLEWRCDKDTVRWLRLNSKIKVRGAASEE